MNDILLAKELHEQCLFQNGRLSTILGMAASRLREESSNQSFKQLGMIVSNHNDRNITEVCAIEELSELIQSICKHKRDRGDIKNTTEELGHAILMCYALINAYNIKEADVINEAMKAVQKMKDQSRTTSYTLAEKSVDQLFKELDNNY